MPSESRSPEGNYSPGGIRGPWPITRRAKPRLADVQCSRMEFRPGDPLLVRTYRRLDEDEKRKLRRTIERWAGCEVRVLIVNCLEMDVVPGALAPGTVTCPYCKGRGMVE